MTPEPGGSAPAPAVEGAPALTRLDPFPTVRVKGRLHRRGVRISLFTVTAPPGVRIEVRCLGPGCPRSRLARSARVTRLGAFERYLPAGVRLTVRITKGRLIGKHTTILIRRGKAPDRRDRCLMPGAGRPVDCSSA